MKTTIRGLVVGVLIGTLPALAAAAGSEAADAAQRKDVGSLRAMISKKVNVNAPQADGTTALHWAAHYNDVEAVQLLLKAGANPSTTNRFGASPLSAAAVAGNAPLVKVLLDAGADAKTASTLDGETVLMSAARSGSVDAVRMLLDRGADANATCLLYGGGATALGLALSSTHPVRAGSRRRLAEVLLRAGARLDGGRASANLSAMAALGDLDNLRLQLDPARPSTTDRPEARHVQAAFWWACEFGRTAVAVYLLDCGADSGARNGNGQTGLHLAACDGWLDTVQRLLARGAPLEVENAWRATPLGSVLWSAVHHDPNVDYTPIVAALIDAGAAVDPRYLEWWRPQDVLTPSSKPRIEALLRREV
jgi:hypothetical protein